MFVCSKGYIVKKNNLSKDATLSITEDLNVRPLNLSNSPIPPPSFKVYIESTCQYRIPYYYGLQKFGKCKDTRPNGTKINLKFNGQMNPETFQDVALDKILTSMSDNSGGGILSLATGFGKTTVALKVISEISVKTLIIVHKEFLLNQWVEKIEQFLPDAKIGYIRQNKVDLAGKDIVIGMLQSLSMKDYPAGTFDTFGLLVVDETHHICSRVFSRALGNMSIRRTLGLSATPDRKDGLTKILHWFMGPLLFKAVREAKDNVDVEVVNYVTTNPNPQGTLVGLISVLTEDEDRNKFIVENIEKFCKEGRKIIILSDRRNHIELLQNKFKESNANVSSGLYMGGIKQSVLKENEKCQVIFGTYSLAHEGLDIPALDTLIMATPKSDVVQAVGRILRETKTEKKSPYIVDIVDEYDVLVKQSRVRKKFYQKTGFNIIKTKQEAVEEEQKQGYLFKEDP